MAGDAATHGGVLAVPNRPRGFIRRAVEPPSVFDSVTRLTQTEWSSLVVVATLVGTLTFLAGGGTLAFRAGQAVLATALAAGAFRGGLAAVHRVDGPGGLSGR